MGTSQSHPIFLALQELLFSKNLKLKKSTLERFLNECDTVAPWFAVSGNLTVPCWDKLGKDLDFAWEQGTLKPGVKPIWKLVRSCLEDHRCYRALENGRNALEMIKEERSEKAESEKGDRRGSLYPSLRDLEQTESEDSHSEGEIQALMSKLEAEVLKRKKTFKDKRQIPAKAAECHSPMPAPPPYQKGISAEHPSPFPSPTLWAFLLPRTLGAGPSETSHWVKTFQGSTGKKSLL